MTDRKPNCKLYLLFLPDIHLMLLKTSYAGSWSFPSEQPAVRFPVLVYTKLSCFLLLASAAD